NTTVIGTPRLDRLATAVGRRCTITDHRNQARLEASTALYSRPKTNSAVQSIGCDGTSSATTHNSSAPNSICQAVKASADGACSWNMRLVNTTESAQLMPAVTANSVLPKPPNPCHG